MKRKLALVLVVSLILSLGAFSTVSFAADNEEIVITTGAEFVAEVVKGKPNTTFKIEGTETLDDGSIGIRLTTDEVGNEVNHISVVDFSGNVIGVDGKNNIQINKPLFASFGSANTTIKNINLKSDETGTFAAGTTEGHGALVSAIDSPYTYEIEKVVNYCNISSTAYYLGGLVGKVIDGTLSLNLCANYGSVTGPSTSRYVAGLIGGLYGTQKINLTVDKSFNAGNITGDRYTAGIAGRVSVLSGKISDSFNVGNITTSTTNGNAGGAGIAVPTSEEVLIINNTYNVGRLMNSNGTGTNLAHIALKAYSNSSENCYYTENEYAGKTSVGSLKTIKDLADGLEALGFSNDVWEYVETDENNKYSLPQLKGNTFVTLDTTWYVEPVVEPEEDVTVAGGTLSFSSADDSTFVPTTSDTGEEITTAYSVVIGRFSLANGVKENDIEYGMLISKTVSGEDLTTETCTKEVRAVKNVGGAYGILFYGNMTPGDTYYVRPYVKYNDSYTYGEASSFVFPE